jgi:hypothetical protein
MRFSINVSILFAELPLLERFATAAQAGFGAVEMRWPSGEDPDAVREAVAGSGCRLVLLNFDAGVLSARVGVGDAVESLACPAHERVERLAVRALRPLLQLRVDVHRHLRVGMSDLPHDPENVEVVGEQGDRDIGASQRVRRGVRKLRKTTSNQMGGRQRGRLADDLVHLLALEATAAAVAEQIRVAVGRRAPRLPACCSRRRRSCSCR